MRPISLLPAEAKLLAKIAADRLRPWTQRALESIPQFAYSAHRQTADSLDRVLSHCAAVRSAVGSNRRSIYKQVSGSRNQRLTGGLQLSLDLTKAYDYLPRRLLLAALQRLQVPEDLQVLILYIHDNALLVLEKNNLREQVRMGRGIRQGCGLSPQLWLAFTVLFFDAVSYLPEQAVSGFADDFHIQWEIHSARDMHQACQQIPRILGDLRKLGMTVSLDKTAALLAIAGTEAPKLLKTYTTRTPNGRVLKIQHKGQTTVLPIKNQHTYLGVVISYQAFERYTVKHRQQLAWQAFHRLKKFLVHSRTALPQRVQLWQACVYSILQYGLTAVGLDQSAATKLRGTVAKQLRLVAHSLGHLTHETTPALLARLGVLDPVQHLWYACEKRISVSAYHLDHLQPTRVQQWWQLLRTSLYQLSETGLPEHASLTEVSQILKVQCSCPDCGMSFPSLHAMRVHRGKEHRDTQTRRETNTTVKNRRRDEFRVHARNGLPICKHCGKSFHGWPAFMGHFSQQACPILHAPQTTATSPDILPSNMPEPSTASTPDHPSEPPSATGVSAPGRPVQNDHVSHDIVPVFYRPELQRLASKGSLTELADGIRQADRLSYCPECNQWLSHPKYLTRHATKMHANIQAAQANVQRWLAAKSQPGQPCRWCRVSYATRPTTHQLSCAVLWTCGHFLARHQSLADTSQADIRDVGTPRAGAAGGSHQGAGDVLGIHAASGPVVSSQLDTTLRERSDGPPGPGSRCRQAQARHPSTIREYFACPSTTNFGSASEIPQAGRQGRAEGGQQPEGTGRDHGQPPARAGTQGSTGDGRDGDTGARGQGSIPRSQPRQPGQERQQRHVAVQPGTPRRWTQLELGRRQTAETVDEPTRAAGPPPQGPLHGGQSSPRSSRAQEHCSGDGTPNTSARGQEHGGHAGQGVLRVSPNRHQRQPLECDQEVVRRSQSVEQVERRGAGINYSTIEECTFPLVHHGPPSTGHRHGNDTEMHQAAKERGLVQDNSYCYLHWDHKKKAHVQAQQQPIEHAALKQCLQLMLQLLVFPNTVGNFHPLRKLTPTLRSEVIPFVLVVQNRSQEAQQLYQCCQRLSRNACMHLVGATMRPAKLGRSPTAVLLDKLLQEL